MKYLFVLAICVSLANHISAQVTDSTTVTSDSMHMNNMDTTHPATMNSMDTMNNSSNATSNMNATDTSMSMHAAGTDTMQMNNNMNSNNSNNMSNMNNNSMNNTMSTAGMTNTMNTKGEKGWASLPVLESYVPDDIMAKIKDKYASGGILYDVTAVQAMPDSTMMQPHDSAMTQTDTSMHMAMPIKYNYVVRMIKDGTLQTETVGSDGMSAVTPGEMKQ